MLPATNLKGDSENWQTRLSRSNNYVTYRCNACQLGVTRQGAELSQISIFFVISMRYPRNHVIHVQVYDTDSATIEES